MPSKIVKSPAFYLRLTLCLFAVLCPACGSEPENVRDMLLYVARSGVNNPDKCLEVYQRFGPEGEEALIRAYFRIGWPQQYPYLDEEVRETYRKSPPTSFLKKLSENKDFLQRILDIARKNLRDEDHNPYQWVQSHDEQLFMRTLKGLDPTLESNWSDLKEYRDRFSFEFEGMWEAYFQAKPDEAFQDMMALFEGHISETTLRARLGRWAGKLLRLYYDLRPGHEFSPEQLHLFFANGFTGLLSHGWGISLTDWLRHCPEDLGLALEQQYNLRNAELERGRGNRLPPEAADYFIQLPAVADVSSFKGQGEQVIIYYREIPPGKKADSLFDNYASIPVISMQSLSQEMTADSLLGDHRVFLISKNYEATDRDKKGDAVLTTWYQVFLTVTWYDAESDSFPSEKFAGNKPGLGISWRQGTERPKRVFGRTPWAEANEFIIQKIVR